MPDDDYTKTTTPQQEIVELKARIEMLEKITTFLRREVHNLKYINDLHHGVYR